MRLIDADALMERMTKAMESGSNLNGTFDLYIEHAPTESTNTPINTPTDLISIQMAIEHWGRSSGNLTNDQIAELQREIESLPSADRPTGWIPVSERLPDAKDCPMDCMVTRKSEFIGNYVDIAVCETNGTWTHEDWDAIVLGDVESGRKTGLISTRDDAIIAWMPLPEPYREDGYYDTEYIIHDYTQDDGYCSWGERRE